MSLEQLTDDLNALADTLAEPDAVRSDNPPATLFHYTGPQALLGMLGTRRLWASDALHMNDTQELKFGLDALGDVIDELVSSGAKESSAGIFLLQESKKHLRPKPCETFIACFSQKPDVLSQWRAYASDGLGYAIGFSVAGLKKIPAPAGWRGVGPRLVQVNYKPKAHRAALKEVVTPIFERVEAFWATNPGDQAKSAALTHGASLLRHVLGPLLTQLKNPGFEEEAEWRLVLDWRDGPMFKPTSAAFRASRFGLTPYVELPFRREDVAEIVHGPRHDPLCMLVTEVALAKYDIFCETLSRSLSSYR